MLDLLALVSDLQPLGFVAYNPPGSWMLLQQPKRTERKLQVSRVAPGLRGPDTLPSVGLHTSREALSCSLTRNPRIVKEYYKSHFNHQTAFQ